MNLIVIFIIYQFMTLICFPFYFLYAALRRIQRKPIIGSLKERIGLVTKSDNNTIWIHAVSVGEILSIAYLVEKLKKESKNLKIYLTCGTLGGKEIATKSVKADYISFIPFDLLPSMYLAFRRIKPKKIFIVEADFWPNLLMIAYFKKIPVTVINARIRPKTLSRYLKFSFFLRPLLNTISNIFVQTEPDIERFSSLGIMRGKLKLLGDIKSFNVVQKLNQTKSEFEKPKNYQVLLVGSLHSGELETYLALFRSLKPKFENFKLILVPRHFHWRAELEERLKESKFNFSIWDDKTNDCKVEKALDQYDILAICKLGVLFNLYNVCDVFALGGTFIPIGGHNLLEPAVWGKVSIVGPYHENCKTFADLLEKNNSLIKAYNLDELTNAVERLLQNPNMIHKMGNNAKLVLEREAAIVNKNLENI